jgi:hypothetical protein
MDKTWDRHQRPNYSLGSLDSAYQLLMDALNLGWQVKEPVYLRPNWSETGPWVYHFLLLRTSSDQPHIITVPLDKEVNELIHRKGWRVDKPRR